MKKRVILSVFGLVLLLGLGLVFLTIKNNYTYQNLIATPSQVPKWEADVRPLQSEKQVKGQLQKLNQKNAGKEVSLTDSKFVVIPGLRGAWSIDPKNDEAAFGTDWVPQGLTQSADDYYVSVYDGDHHLNSLIFQIDKKSKKYVKTLILNSKAHVGGITYDDDHQRLIYSDDTDKMAGFGYLDQARIDAYQASQQQAPIKSEKINWQIGIRTSAITMYQQQLIVAKYGFHQNDRSIVSIPLNKAGFPPTISDQGSEMLAKVVDTADKKTLEKVFIESLIKSGYISSFNHGWDRMQGISLSKSGIMIVSQSNGRRQGKLLIRYRMPDPSRWEKMNLTSIAKGPATVAIPRAVEEVSINREGTELAMIFESGAKKYRKNKYPFLPPDYMDRILILPMQVTNEA